MRRFLLVFGLALLAHAEAPCFAAGQSWVAVGPPGGDVRSLVADPRDPKRVYLGTARGNLYRSDDGGGSWRRMVPGFPLRGQSLDEIVVDARGAVYVGYWEVDGKGGGVARSDNGGRTFTILKGLEGHSVRALALSSSDPKTMAAGTLEGVYLSRDGGRSWKRITPEKHADLRNFESLAFDPGDARILYAGTWHLGWKTVDGGESWEPVHKGMIDDSHVMTLTVVPRDPDLLFATACTGIYRSTDRGKEWTKIPGIPYASRRTRAFFQGGHEGTLLLAGTTEGLWMSEDGGGTWRCATARQLVINAILVQPDGTILLGTEDAGVIRSSDRGYSWTTSNLGFSERFVSRMAFDPAGRRLIVAVHGDPRFGGLFASSSIDGPWTHLGKGLEGRQVLAIAPLGETVLAGTDDGIYRQDPNGGSWVKVSTTLDGRKLEARVTELVAGREGRVVAGTTAGLIRSIDGGETWSRPQPAIEREILALAASPQAPDKMIAATASGYLRSEDGGHTWTPTTSTPGDVNTHAVVFSPSHELEAFATTSGGLFRSADGGDTWEPVAGGLPQSDLTGIAIHPDGRTLYASDFTWGGVFRSRDGGQTWKRMPVDGLASDRVWTVSIDPESPDQLLVGAVSGGLHRLITSTMATGPQGASSTRNGLPAPAR